MGRLRPPMFEVGRPGLFAQSPTQAWADSYKIGLGLDMPQLGPHEHSYKPSRTDPLRLWKSWHKRQNTFALQKMTKKKTKHCPFSLQKALLLVEVNHWVQRRTEWHMTVFDFRAWKSPLFPLSSFWKHSCRKTLFSHILANISLSSSGFQPFNPPPNCILNVPDFTFRPGPTAKTQGLSPARVLFFFFFLNRYVHNIFSPFVYFPCRLGTKCWKE